MRGFGQRGDAIGAEVTKVLAHLAPSRQHAHVIEEAESDRPNLTVGVASFRINIIEHELMLGADGAADGRKIDRLSDELAPRPHQQSICIDRVTQIRRQDGSDLGERVVRGVGKPPVGTPGNKSRPEHQRFQFLLGKHQRRKHEARPQHKADAGFAIDRCALGDQALDVAIDRA